MIANMSKYSFIVHHREYIEFLQTLRSVGVVHIKEKGEGVSDDELLNEKLKELRNIDEIIKYLKLRKVVDANTPETYSTVQLIPKLAEVRQAVEALGGELQVLQKEIAVLKPWGNFSWEVVDKLKEENQIIHFYSCSKSKFDPQWVETYNLFKIESVGSLQYFVLITNSVKAPDLNADLMILPKQSIEKLELERSRIKQKLEEQENLLNQLAVVGLPLLDDEKNRIKGELDFREVELQASDKADDKIKFFEGYVPADNKVELETVLDKTAVVFVEQRPTIEENVPIKLKNNRFSRLFEMIGEMYSLPNHKELDLTPYYAPFYAIFFGFCLGDAGYGLILLAIGLIVGWKGKKELKPTMALASILGVSTIIFGLIGGTFLGMNLYEMGVGPYASLNERLASQGKTINDHLFSLSLILGGIQILFGMSVKAANQWVQFGWKYALGTIGWISLIVGSITIYLLSSNGFIEGNSSIFYYILFGITGIFILLLNNPDKNVFVNIGLGLYDVYNMVTGLMGDLLSYIRLFALGISSAILGYVFNSLAVELSPDIPVLKIVVMALILLFGHGINLFMAALGSFVHPMRLTLVEFYKNAGFTGGGIKYNPFKKR